MNESAAPGRQTPFTRRDMIAITTAAPSTIELPLNHSAATMEYHGAAWPDEIQFAMGSSPNTATTTAATRATARFDDGGDELEALTRESGAEGT